MVSEVAAAVPVGLELGARRTFAWALDWPGWCRSGRDEAAALEALAAYRHRYLAVAVLAGEGLPAVSASRLAVVERLPGSMTTDFGAPGSIGARDREPLDAASAHRATTILDAAWRVFDQVASCAPAELSKGPRGGGRDRDKIVGHVLAADVIYARKLGIRAGQSAIADPGAGATLRRTVLEAIAAARAGDPPVAKGWPPRYYLRRAAWHLTDHAWEIQDRSQPPA